MFDKILIANRGEIACRIIATCRRLGIGTVAVFSEADASARHVRLADTAHCIGPAAAAGSYLRGERIIHVARVSCAQAIHPGYGFLSENAAFAQAVEAAGLTLIGPSAETMELMGSKAAAKARMAPAGVPLIPGYHGDDQSDAALLEEAQRIGFPLMLKAAAGGGGKGMRVVKTLADFAEALKATRREASGAFGDQRMILERYLEQPRHIEAQIFADVHGNTVHLFERDCSSQRRHQKIIEEAPAPHLPESLRAELLAAAVRAAEAVHYRGAGTVEFLVDGDEFFFLEMNTRLQVEHPVTEAITGIDLVQWQLRVAAGEELPLRQEALCITGHAFEARLYAEDVPAGFLPATGRLGHLRFSECARIETGVRTGDEISPWYDPMIAKIVTHGPNRAIALKRLEKALAETEVAGTVTNLAFLSALTRHTGFRAGDVDTGLIARDLGGLIDVAEPEVWQLAAAAALAIDLARLNDPLAGFDPGAPIWQDVRLEEVAHLRIAVTGPARAQVQVDGQEVSVRAEGDALRVEGAPGLVRGIRMPGRITLFGTSPRVFGICDPLERARGEEAGAGVVFAPMPGLVKAVFVAKGDSVEIGARLAILEAMKMEHTLTAARAGVVSEVLTHPGAQVDAGVALVRLEEVT